MYIKKLFWISLQSVNRCPHPIIREPEVVRVVKTMFESWTTCVKYPDRCWHSPAVPVWYMRNSTSYHVESFFCLFCRNYPDSWQTHISSSEWNSVENWDQFYIRETESLSDYTFFEYGSLKLLLFPVISRWSYFCDHFHIQD